MVIAYHIVFSAYGFWLPNDPRGSWSDFVRVWELRRFGPAIRPGTTRSQAHCPHDHELRLAAKEALRYPEVHFSGIQARAIGHGFANAINRSHFTIFACSILPEHVHLVVRHHPYKAEKIINQLKGEASKALVKEKLHPFQNNFLPGGKRHTPWTEKGWKVFLYDSEDIYHAIQYVQENPIKEGLAAQRWYFVTPYH